MADPKIVFVQAKDEDTKALGRCLGSIKQSEYVFVLIPASTKFLSKEDLQRMLEKVL